MVRLWTLEAIAHQAEAVCYFRWRQAPFAQEQMHAGLLCPDSSPSHTHSEVLSVKQDLEQLGDIVTMKSDVAIVFDYESCWAWQTQPQGESFDYFSLVFEFYQALRQLGLSIDILPPTQNDLSDYRLVLIPGLMHADHPVIKALDDYSGAVVIGPRSGSKTTDFSIPEPCPALQPMMALNLRYVESLRQGAERKLAAGGAIYRWFEKIETKLDVIEALDSSEPVLVNNGNRYYLAGWPERTALTRILSKVCKSQQIDIQSLPDGVRIRETQSHRFFFNYNAETVQFDGLSIEPAGVHWQQK